MALRYAFAVITKALEATTHGLAPQILFPVPVEPDARVAAEVAPVVIPALVIFLSAEL
jgi:hypothetical protein